MWWLVVVATALGVVAIVEAIEGAHGRSAWFWGFWGMTALCMATGLRLLGIARERDGLRAEIADPHSAEAVARRLEGFAHEGERLLADMPPAEATPREWYEAINQEGWEGILKHWAFEIESELRRNSPQLLPQWNRNPPDLPEGTGWASASNARRMVEWASAELRNWAQGLRGDR